jgi:hypothetical protein
MSASLHEPAQSRAARRKREAAERARAWRAERKARAGVDEALVDALANIARDDPRMRDVMRDLLAASVRDLRRKGVDRRTAVGFIQRRLLGTDKPGQETA